MRLFQKNKIFNSTEEVVSMFLGLIIVVVVVSLIFNFIRKRKGDVTLPGVSSNINISEVGKNGVGEGKQEVKTYTVTRGDNLWKIAVKEYNNGFLWQKIAEVNNLKNPGVISVNQKLVIPEISSTVSGVTTMGKTVASTTKEQIQPGEYVVVRGDSLWKIAIRVYGDGYQWTKIWNANKNLIRNPSLIHAGNKLVIPSI